MILIYIVTNGLNGKFYIGRTNKQCLEKRLIKHRQDAYRGVNTYFYRALRKYKVENFHIQEVCRTNSIEEAVFVESFLIASLPSLSPFGYNSTLITNQFVVETAEAKMKKRMAKQGKKRALHKNYVGVRSKQSTGKFYSAIRFEGKIIERGNYACEQEAAQGYDRMALFVYGKNARLNFPKKRSEYLLDNLEKSFYASRKNIPRYLSLRKYMSRFAIASTDKKTKKFKILSVFDTREEAFKQLENLRKSDNQLYAQVPVN